MAATDVGQLIGMTVAFPRLDLEAAVKAIADAGLQAVEVHGVQLGPGMPGVGTTEEHARVAGEFIRASGLIVSSLNVVADQTFDPHGGTEARERTVAGLATHLRWAAAMGAPRVLIFEGRCDAVDVPAACVRLADIIVEARGRSRLTQPPDVSVELHPFTFALVHNAVAELAGAMRAVGAGLCLDFCHVAVALGSSFVDVLTDEVIAGVNHVHLSDSDCVSSELHFPPGLGVLDLEAIVTRLAGLSVAIGWDLFSWPTPFAATRDYRDRYPALVGRHAELMVGGPR